MLHNGRVTIVLETADHAYDYWEEVCLLLLVFPSSHQIPKRHSPEQFLIGSCLQGLWMVPQTAPPKP